MVLQLINAVIDSGLEWELEFQVLVGALLAYDPSASMETRSQMWRNIHEALERKGLNPYQFYQTEEA